MATDDDDVTIMITSEVDVLRACREGQRLAREIGLNTVDAVKVATAVSEVASNGLYHAQQASIYLRLLEDENRRGLSVVAADKGPGIADVGAALRDGYSTRKSLGIGLGAARRLMDDFRIETEVGKGTTITMTKWST